MFWHFWSAALNMFACQFCVWNVSSFQSTFTPAISFCITFMFHVFNPALSLHRSPQAEASYCSPCVTSPPPTLWPWSSSKLATCPRLKTTDLQVHIGNLQDHCLYGQTQKHVCMNSHIPINRQNYFPLPPSSPDYFGCCDSCYNDTATALK